MDNIHSNHKEGKQEDLFNRTADNIKAPFKSKQQKLEEHGVNVMTEDAAGYDVRQRRDSMTHLINQAGKLYGTSKN